MPRFPLLYSSCFLLENVISTPFTLPLPLPNPLHFPLLVPNCRSSPMRHNIWICHQVATSFSKFWSGRASWTYAFCHLVLSSNCTSNCKFFNFAILFCLQTVRLNLTYFNFLLPSFSVNFGLMLGKLWSDKLSTPLFLELAFCGGS